MPRRRLGGILVIVAGLGEGCGASWNNGDIRMSSEDSGDVAPMADLDIRRWTSSIPSVSLGKPN